MTPAAEAVCVPARLVPPGSPQAKQLRPNSQLSLGQSCHRQKALCLCVQGHFGVSDSLWPCGLWLARLLRQRGGFSRQEYWSVLANSGHHTLLELYISCCPSLQSPESLVLPEPLRPKQLPHLHSWPSGANPSPPGQPQEQTPVEPHVEVEIKPHLKPRGSVAKEEDPKPAHQLYKLQTKSTRSTRQTLCLWNM